MSDAPETTIQAKFVIDGGMPDQSWEDWCIDLNKLAGDDVIETCGAECWRDFYDDGYTAADAWSEDGTYD